MSSDYFPRGKRIGTYVPDWDSKFGLTSKGRSLLRSYSPIRTGISKHLTKKGFATNVLYYISRGHTNHWILDNKVPDAAQYCRVITWLLQNGYIVRTIDKSRR